MGGSLLRGSLLRGAMIRGRTLQIDGDGLAKAQYVLGIGDLNADFVDEVGA